jgi:hypothetical protein
MLKLLELNPWLDSQLVQGNARLKVMMELDEGCNLTTLVGSRSIASSAAGCVPRPGHAYRLMPQCLLDFLSIITLLWFVGLWWILWQFRVVEVDRWSFFSLFLLLAGPATLFFAVTLLLPSTQPGEQLDSAGRLDHVGRLFFLCLCGTVIWLGIAEMALLGQPFAEPHRFGQIIVATPMAVAAAFPSRRTANIAGALNLLLAIIAFSTFRAGLN